MDNKEIFKQIKEEEDKAHAALLAAIKAKLAELEELEKKMSGHWISEDLFYRFYHQSCEVYYIQKETEKIVAALQSLQPEKLLQKFFAEVVADGTGRKFTPDANLRWTQETRPILEAFFHAREFLRLVIQYGRALEESPMALPSGWAAVLALYGMR